MPQECIEHYGKEFFNIANIKVDKLKSLLAWCMVYCSLNNLNDKANRREAGEGE